MVLCYSVAMAKGTQHRSCSLEVPNTSLIRMESLLWISVCRWVCHQFFNVHILYVLCYSVYDELLRSLSPLCVFRVDMGKPVRSSSSITADCSRPLSRWHRTMISKRAWYHQFIYTITDKLCVSTFIELCVFVAQAGSGARLSAERQSLPEDLD